jgi:hypothetical protein
MRTKSLFSIALLVLCVGICDANTLNGFFPIAPQMVDNNITDWDANEVTEGFKGRLGRCQIAGSSYSLNRPGFSGDPIT